MIYTRKDLIKIQEEQKMQKKDNKKLFKKPTITENQELNITIIGYGEKGDGISKTPEGYTIITPQTIIHNTYKVKINKVLPKYAFATIIKRIEETEEEETQ